MTPTAGYSSVPSPLGEKDRMRGDLPGSSFIHKGRPSWPV
jgi:hypothetical protein